jgi:hypothetical protein
MERGGDKGIAGKVRVRAKGSQAIWSYYTTATLDHLLVWGEYIDVRAKISSR